MASKKLLIQVYGDSLTMPRIDPLTIYYETYHQILADKLHVLENNTQIYSFIRSHPGVPVMSLYDEYLQDLRYFGNENNSILVIHCGIVDCAPRPIPLVLRALISRTPIKIREKIINIIHNRRAWLLKRGFSWQVTKIAQFEKIYQAWLSLAVKNSSVVAVVNIAPTTPEMEKHSPGLSSNIKSYNQIIDKLVQKIGSPNLVLFDAYNEILSHPDGLAKFIHPLDGHHLTKEGHQLYADCLVELLQKDTLKFVGEINSN